MIKEGFVTREELFIATKLSDEKNAGYENTIKQVMKQLKDLQLDYIDLYMLHSPIRDPKLQESSWKALEFLYQQGNNKLFSY